MKGILPTIVISQFFCTSVWFAGNAVSGDIAAAYHLPGGYAAHLASAVQFGFIAGTLLYAVLMIADRFRPSAVFFTSAVVAAIFNLAIVIDGISVEVLLFCRFFTGFFLAGIYPVGMKIAADHYDRGLGKSLGFLVGALVLGTSFPHLLRSVTLTLPWKYVLYGTSAMAIAGGLAIYALVPDGPYRKPAAKVRLTGFVEGFRNSEFRSAAFGYFGHMWELYAFWVFVPAMLAGYKARHPEATFPVPLLSFFVIAAGSVSCAVSGLLSQRFGAKRIATLALFTSGACCLLSPLFLFTGVKGLFFVFLFIWGIAVIADSPLFSTLVAQHAPASSKGSSLTIVNCIGFAITIVSIQLVNSFAATAGPEYIYLLLAAGPVLGVAALLRRK